MTELVISTPDGSRQWTWSAGERPDLPGTDGAITWDTRYPDVRTDLFGIGEEGLLRRVPALTDLRFLVEVFASDFALGPTRTRLVIEGDGRITSVFMRDDDPVERLQFTNFQGKIMSLSSKYALLMDWIHGDATFGTIMWSGGDVKGHLFDFASLDGIVSAPHVSDTPAIVESLLELG